VGGVLIPAMKKQGYDIEFAVALVACAAVMGVIIPPSILMVVWGGVISVSIGGLFLAGFLPGMLMALSFMVVVYIYAKRRGYPVFPRPTPRELAVAVGQAILPILTPGIIIGGIVGGFFTPTEASVVAVLYAMLLGVFIYRRLGPRELREAMYDSGRFAAISLFCIGTASAFGWLLAYFHIPQLFVDMVSSWGGGITSVGLITAFCFLVVGCFIDAIPAIIIVGTILAPLAESVGMHPIHFAVIGVISIAYGLVTPPYGLCLMISCTIGGIKIKHAVRDTLILFVPMLLVLLFVILVPDALLWLPRTLMPKLVD
jgi:tripartite ATP-independent transporter DctM subunit